MSAPDQARWAPGTVIVQEEYWRDQLVTVRPITVVEDSSALLALFSHAGAAVRSGAMRGRQQIPIGERVRVYLADQQPRLEARANRFNVLTLNPPGEAHSIWLFWDPHWRLTNWYVNLQPPFRRHSDGVSVGDYLLDLIVTPALRWSWKDEDEFEAVCATGVFSQSERTAIRAEGEALARRVEACAWPFDSPWPDWRPDPAWPAPSIPDGWHPHGRPDAR